MSNGGNYGFGSNLGSLSNIGGLNLSSGSTPPSLSSLVSNPVNLGASSYGGTSSSANGLSGINYQQLGSIAGGILGGPSSSQNQAAVNAASPFLSQYAQYQPMLQQLMTQGPQNTAATDYLLKQGANATNAAAAANGLTGSGNQLAALQQNAMGIAAQNQQQQYAQLAQLSGANSGNGAAASQAITGQNQSASSGGSGIGGLIGAAISLF